MSVTLEVLKTKQNKCIIFLIKVCQKLVTYFEGQETPHCTSRWMSAEHWAAYDKKVKELFLSNKLNNLEKCLSYKLGHGVSLQLENSVVPKLPFCEILQENLRPEDIINVIECKIDWEDESSTKSNIKEYDGINNNLNSIDCSPASNIPTSQFDDNLVVISDQSYISDCAGEAYKSKTTVECNILPSSSGVSDMSQKPTKTFKSSHDENSQKKNKQKKEINFDSSDSIEFPLDKCKPKEVHRNKNNLSTEKTRSPYSLKPSSPSKVTKDKYSGQLKAVEKRKRKLYNEDIVCESHERRKLCKRPDFQIVDINVDVESNTLSSNFDISDLQPNTTLKQSEDACSKNKSRTTDFDSYDYTMESNFSQNTPKTKKANEINFLTPKKNTSPTFPKDFTMNENDSDQSEINSTVEKLEKSYDDNEDRNHNSHDRLKLDKNHTRSSRKLFEPDHKQKDVYMCKTPEQSSSHTTKGETSTVKKKKSRHEHAQKSCDQEKHSMENWLGKKHSHDVRSSSSKLSKDKKKHEHASKYKTVLSPIESNSVGLNEKQMGGGIKPTEVNTKSDRNIIENLRELVSKKPKKVKMLDLVKIPLEKILASFDKHRSEFDSIFQTHKSQTKFRGLNSVDHFLVIDLLPNKIQQKMMEKLSDLYEKNTAGTPKYGELFSMVLMPEWILRIFMSHFKMNRTEAILHIKAQNAYKDYCVTDDQLDKMIKKN